MTIQAAVAAMGSGPLEESTVTTHLRPLFSRVLQRDEIYLANHSLGRPLDRTAEDVREFLDAWYSDLDSAWEGVWADGISRFRSLVAHLIGVQPATQIVPKASVGQGLRAVLNALEGAKPVVVATRGEFDSVDFILKTYAYRGRAEIRWVEPRLGEVPVFDASDILDAIRPGVDLVVVSAVYFGTGQVLGHLEDIVARCREVGATSFVDAYHAAGVVPIDFLGLGADFMAGGSYKYTRGGPGACWLALHPCVLEKAMRTLDTGWFAKRDTFSYARPEEPLLAEGGDAWLESTPPVITAFQALAGLEFTLAVGVDRLRDYSLRQQRILHEAFHHAGVPCFLPRVPEQFGGFSLVPHPRAKEVCAALRQEGVNTDSRGGVIRFGPDVLTTEEELRVAARACARII